MDPLPETRVDAFELNRDKISGSLYKSRRFVPNYLFLRRNNRGKILGELEISHVLALSLLLNGEGKLCDRVSIKIHY